MKIDVQGWAAAQFAIGAMYSQGQGFLQDYKEAVKWYTKAAEQGQAPAQSGLGYAYATGEGVLQDNVRAHIWFNLAGANGYEGGSKNRDMIVEDMTSDQVTEAQRMAREMVEANPKLMGE